MNDLTTVATFTYQATGNALRTTESTIGHDGAHSSKSATYSVFTRHLLEQIDENGTLTCIRYTPDGKIAEKSTRTGPNNIETRCFNYTYPDPASTNLWPVMTETNTAGLRREYQYDGTGRLCRIMQQDDDAPLNAEEYTGTLREVKNLAYNSLGQLIRETSLDWLWDLNASITERLSTPVRKSKEYEYDGWGEVAITRHNDGRVEIDSHDPVDNSYLQGLQGLSMVLTQNNAFDEPEFVALMDTDNGIHARTSMSYDGFGRQVSEIDNNGATTCFKWDVFDRLVHKTLPDGTVVKKTYAPFTTEKCISTLTVQGVAFASAQYDGLERVSQDQCGERTQRYQYRNGERLPNAIIPPANQPHMRRYAFHLDNTITSMTAPGINQVFNYNDKSGKMTQAHEGNLNQQMDYFPSGLLQEERMVVNNVDMSATTYRHSMSGLLQFKRDSKGIEHRYYYDDVGRLKRSTHATQEIMYEYDNFSRISTIETRDGTATFTTTIRYDSFSREVMRTYQAGNHVSTLKLAYTPEGKICERELRDTSLLLLEKYSYDQNDRLCHYQCSGKNAPRDHQGRVLSAQHYQYDCWGNITRLENTHDGVTSAVTYEFNPNDPTQLSSIVENGQRVTLQYDVNGNLTSDEKGQKLVYDAKNRLVEVKNANNQCICRYHYDAFDKLVAQEIPGNNTNRYFYSGQSLSNADLDGKELTWMDNGSALRLGHIETESNRETSYHYGLMVDGTPCLNNSVDSSIPLSYTPFGFRSLLSTIPGLGGAQIDPITGWYFLGNGYRVFNPVLMRFHSPDSWSPFGGGGINPYIYALSDPINKNDPSGHLSEMAIAGIVLGTVGILMSIFTLGAALPAVAAKFAVLKAIAATSVLGKVSAGLGVVSNTLSVASAATSESNPKASSALNIASLATGLFGLAVGSAGAGYTIKLNIGKTAAERTGGTFGIGRNVLSIGGVSSRFDTAITAFEISSVLAYTGTTIAAEFVDEDTAEKLNKAALAFNVIGLAAGLFGSGKNLRKAAKHHTDSLNITVEDPIMSRQNFELGSFRPLD